jgi:hypothetical protein
MEGAHMKITDNIFALDASTGGYVYVFLRELCNSLKYMIL